MINSTASLCFYKVYITMNKFFYIATLLLILTNPSHADVPKKNASIEKMFSVMGIDRQLKGGFEAMLPIVDQISSQLELNKDEKEELKNIYRDWFHNDIDSDAIVSKMVYLYADNFNEKEISELISFYEPPTGQKFLKTSPKLMMLGAQIGMEEGQLKQRLLLERLTPFMKKHKK